MQKELLDNPKTESQSPEDPLIDLLNAGKTPLRSRRKLRKIGYSCTEFNTQLEQFRYF